MSSSTVKTERYRWIEHILNGIATLFFRFGSTYTHINVESTVETARKKTGLHNLGDDEHMKCLCDLVRILKQQDGLTPLARFIIKQQPIKGTMRRLRIEAYIKQ
jgi:hypothetical protein